LTRAIRVALDAPLRVGDAALTFDAGAAPQARRGDGVIVPLGRRLVPGVVLGEDARRPDLRPVVAAAGEAIVPASALDLAEWVAGEYLSSVGEALAVAVPWDALWAGLRLTASATDVPGASDALDALARRPAPLARASRLLRPAWASLEGVARAGALRVEWAAPAPAAAPRRAPSAATSAPSFQGASAAPRLVETAVAEAAAGGPGRLLVVGWQRAPAYLAAIRRALSAGWSAVAVFPSLEAAASFADAIEAAGIPPVVMHGDLAPARRLAAWRAARDARGAVVVGTRSAVFVPLPGPVLVIVDDEDNSGHKEERAPRYLTAGVAAARTAAGGMLILGATTPTVASYAEVRAGRMRMAALPSPRARIAVVDVRRRAEPDEPISRPVLEAVRRTVRRRGRVVILVDRKGYAALQCRECGAPVPCPACRVPMRYLREQRRLRCRLCGRTDAAPAACARCGGSRFAPIGAGTERVAAAARRLTTAVWRLDREAVPAGRELARVLDPFRRRGGVLVATPLVVPWIETLDADLVAIVGADRWLHRPEYRAAERALALMRAVGSAVRSPVLLETADPSHPAVRAAQAPSLRPFYEEELAVREALGYPPARSLLVLRLKTRTAGAAQSVADDLIRRAPPGTDVLGPAPVAGAPGGAEIVIKTADRAAARALVWPLLTGAGLPTGTRIAADVDPIEV
jgi:primosomal protein N' (replication factor Y)